MLTTLANVKEYLDVPSAEPGDDAFLNRLVSAADALIKKYCGRVIEGADITEYHSAVSGQTELTLVEYPVNSIASIHDDPDRTYDAATLIDVDEYVYNAASGIVTLDGASFGAGIDNVKVVYNAGYATVPADLEQAAIELIAKEFYAKDKLRHGVLSVSAGGETTSYFSGALYPETKAVLDRYRKVRL